MIGRSEILEMPPPFPWRLPSAKSEHDKASPEASTRANPTSFAIPFIAANNQLQSPSAEEDVLSSAGRDQIAADEMDSRGQENILAERRYR